jgi:hypothetical protein
MVNNSSNIKKEQLSFTSMYFFLMKINAICVRCVSRKIVCIFMTGKYPNLQIGLLTINLLYLQGYSDQVFTNHFLSQLLTVLLQSIMRIQLSRNRKYKNISILLYKPISAQRILCIVRKSLSLLPHHWALIVSVE